MPVRIGVDVGGTFTKAVACYEPAGSVVAHAVVPTTHSSSGGVADGVVEAVGLVADEVHRSDLGPVLLIAHSSTQAVNALLEGDTASVGVLGIGRRPDLRRSRRRTHVDRIGLAPGHNLTTFHEFLDATSGLEREQVRSAIRNLLAQGAETLCVSEAFGVEDARGEWLALEVAAGLGVPACAGHELTGLYGLEMRTVTAALNASILPAATRTALLVESAVAERGLDIPLLVMRGDGGAADLTTLRRRPLVTAFSGPAASVSGALRHLRPGEAFDGASDFVVIEVGGTSTNVSVIRGGRPVLAYVTVLDHMTCVRSLDVRVAGVAGGSLLRVGRRSGRLRLIDVGPRSAHIAGLPYCSFAAPHELDGAKPHLIAPRPGDPPEYLVLESPSGRRFAATVTCAANALDRVPAGSYARGDQAAARAAFTLLGEHLGIPSQVAAEQALAFATARVNEVVAAALSDHPVTDPTIVGVGGGAGALIPSVAGAAGVPWTIPVDAEVISSIGDALSLVRVEVERTMARPTATDVAEAHRAAERAAVEAGASATSVHVEGHAVPEKGALRVVAIGSLALDASVERAHHRATDEERAAAARARLGEPVELVTATDFYSLFASSGGGAESERSFAIVDSHGSIAASGRGVVVSGSGPEVAAGLQERLPRLARHYGPITVAPALRILHDSRLVDLSVLSHPDDVLAAALSECALADGGNVAAVFARD